MEDCIFCKIIEGKIPCTKVYEDAKVLAFLDISPVNPGHILVIPKKHYETYMDADDNTICDIMKVVKKLSRAVLKSMKADGINISSSNYKAAGQDVPHLHIHIMPRFNNDGLKFDWPSKKYSDGEMKTVAEAIRKSL